MKLCLRAGSTFAFFSIVGELWIFFREALNPQAISVAPAKRTAIDAASFPLQERLHEIAATPTVANAKANETMITSAAFSPRVFPFLGSSKCSFSLDSNSF